MAGATNRSAAVTGAGSRWRSAERDVSPPPWSEDAKDLSALLGDRLARFPQP